MSEKVKPSKEKRQEQAKTQEDKKEEKGTRHKARENPKRRESIKKRSPRRSVGNTGDMTQRRRLPTLPHCIAVPSAMAGLTALFGMGRGGTPPP